MSELTKGRKFDEGKPRWDLLPTQEVEEVVRPSPAANPRNGRMRNRRKTATQKLIDRARRFAVRVHGIVIRFRRVPLTEHVVGTAGDNVPAEIEYRDPKGRVVGFWAYGHFHPDYPYQG